MMASAPAPCSAVDRRLRGRAPRPTSRDRTGGPRTGVSGFRSRSGSPTYDLEAEALGARLDDADGLGMGVAVDEEGVALDVLTTRLRHRHGLGRGGALIEQRGIGELEAGQVDDHLLEIEQRFEPALADFGLVGRVGRVPAGIFQHIAQDHLGRDACRNSPCRSSRCKTSLRSAIWREIGQRGALRQRFGRSPAACSSGSSAGSPCAMKSSSDDAPTCFSMVGGLVRPRADMAAE